MFSLLAPLCLSFSPVPQIEELWAHPSTDFMYGDFILTLPDINADGYEEVLVTSDSSYEILSGIDGSLLRSHIGRYTIAALTEDLDADGLRDYVLFSTINQISILSSATGQNLFTYNEPIGDLFGYNGIVIPDFTGDGLPELLVSAPYEDWNGKNNLGAVYLVFSDQTPRQVVYRGKRANDKVLIDSYFVSGDFDGDGVLDYAFGAPAADTGSGNGYNSRGFVAVISGSTFSEIVKLDGSWKGQQFGKSLAVSDWNGDGVAELLIGAIEEYQDDGFVAVYESSGWQEIDRITGNNGKRIGTVIVPTDATGDGNEDLLISGSTYLFVASHRTGAILPDEARAYDQGIALANTDLDGDGTNDFFGAQNMGTGTHYIRRYSYTPLALSVTNFAAGANANISIDGASPGDKIYLGYSLTGGGPTSTVFGDVALSSPIQLMGIFTANNSGQVQHSASIPANAIGLNVWMHAYSTNRALFSTLFSGTVG
ncbi:MAG: FG-GAP and VCBS repeat-containing protein [Planctomycetota bacterium]|jgi:hypothetical protein|nr:FG-GAP and VCBS repeat-containing protein [Planctomycetota bacterium]